METTGFALTQIHSHKSYLYCRLNFEFLLRQAAKPSDELCAKAHFELSSFELIERNLPIQNELSQNFQFLPAALQVAVILSTQN